MLSYRHSFHAGNFADVIKHIVLVEILDHMTKKDKSFDYIDTHAGAGLFDLQSTESQRMGEHVHGIGKLNADDWPELARYFELIRAHNHGSSLRFYPGSPSFALQCLRPHDRAWLFELHSTEVELLKQHVCESRKVKILREDGLKGLLGLLPPASRRALVLIDPSYEIKTDYDQVVRTLVTAYKKFATGVYVLWYPVVERQRVQRLEKQLVTSGIKNIQRFEIGLAPDSGVRGLTAAGLIVINPPWGLLQHMTSILPKLVRTLGLGGGAFHKCDVLVEE